MTLPTVPFAPHSCYTATATDGERATPAKATHVTGMGMMPEDAYGEIMREFFDRRMDMGRYPDDTRREIFVSNRQYFDQILHKNHKFRHEYAEAYERWAAGQGADRTTRQTLLPLRIQTAVDLMGEAALEKLFARLLDAVAADHVALPPDFSYRDTLPGERCDVDPALAGFMEPVRRFWLRLALPDVWEEDDM